MMFSMLTTEQKIRVFLGFFGQFLMAVAICGFGGWWGLLFLIGFVLEHVMALSAKSNSK